MKPSIRTVCSSLLIGLTLTSASLVAQEQPPKPISADQKKSSKLDINKADVAAIDRLPGVDAATAKKIVAQRPYKSDVELSKVIPSDVLRKIKPYIRFDADAKTATSDRSGRGLTDVADNRKLDINKADWAALDALPGVDAATAMKIIAQRPYKSDAELSKVIPSDVLRKIKPHIRFDADAKTVTSDRTGRGLDDVVDNRKLDINKADWAALDALPGVDAATAKKIIAQRPYKSDVELSKVIPSDVLRKIKPHIRFDADVKTVTSDRTGRGLDDVADYRKLDINKADWAALDALPGVDAATAKKIIAQRPYKSDVELSKVIPSDVLRKIKPHIRFDADVKTVTSDRTGRGLDDVADYRKLDINKADVAAIDRLPGVDAATAKKIVAQRPYKSDVELSKVIPSDVLRKIKPHIRFDADAKTVTSDRTGRGLDDVVDNRKLDINKADWAALVALPGVDADIAKKIIARRPYKSDTDLSKVIPSDVLRKIKPYICVSADADVKTVTSDRTGRGLDDVADNRKLDINKADWAALDALPGVDAATAKKIIAQRPYKSDAELSKVIPSDVLRKIAPRITIDGKPVWSGPPIRVNVADSGEMEVALYATMSGYELRLDGVSVIDGTAMIQCTMTIPGQHEITTDAPEKHSVKVERKRLGAKTSMALVMVSTVQRGVDYIQRPEYVPAAWHSMMDK